MQLRSWLFSYPTRYFATSFIGETVAESPTRVGCASVWSRSRLTERWEPRLLSARAWISSTMTHWVLLKFSLNFFVVSMIANDSGVVMRMWGGFLSMALFLDGEVSPVLTPTRMLSFLSCFLRISLICLRGVLRFLSMSLASALSGLM